MITSCSYLFSVFPTILTGLKLTHYGQNVPKILLASNPVPGLLCATTYPCWFLTIYPISYVHAPGAYTIISTFTNLLNVYIVAGYYEPVV